MQSAVRGDLSRCVAQNLRARPSMGVQAPVDCKHVGWIVVDLKKNSSTLDARVKATRLANEFATHSVLEAVTTHQEWMNQQRDMFAEASRWLFAMIRKSWTPPAQMLAGADKAEHLTV